MTSKTRKDLTLKEKIELLKSIDQGKSKRDAAKESLAAEVPRTTFPIGDCCQ